MTQSEKTDIQKLLFHFESDSKIGHIGIGEQLTNLTDRVDKLTDRVDSIESRHKIIYRVGVGMGGVATFVIGKSWSIILTSVKSIF